jgi:hypothetical protein
LLYKGLLLLFTISGKMLYNSLLYVTYVKILYKLHG